MFGEAREWNDAAPFDDRAIAASGTIRRCGCSTLRMLVTPGSIFLPAMANAGEGMPRCAMASSRTPSTAVRTIGTVSRARISLLSSIDSKRLLGRIGKRSQCTISFFRPTCAGTELDFPDDDSVLLNGRLYVTATAQ